MRFPRPFLQELGFFFFVVVGSLFFFRFVTRQMRQANTEGRKILLFYLVFEHYLCAKQSYAFLCVAISDS